MLKHFRLKSSFVPVFVPLLCGFALVENVTATPLETAVQEMQSAKRASLEAVRSQYQPSIDALEKEVKAAQQELDAFYRRDPDAKLSADRVPMPSIEFTPKTINQTELKNDFSRKTQSIIDAQAEPLREAVKSANKTKDKKVAEETVTAFAKSADQEKQVVASSFAADLEAMLNALNTKERELIQQKAKIVSIVSYFINPKTVNDKAPDFAGEVRGALQSAGSKSLATLAVSEPPPKIPGSGTPVVSPGPIPAAVVGGAPNSPPPPSPTPMRGSPSASSTPASSPALPSHPAVPSREVPDPTSGKVEELSERMAKLERSLGSFERSSQDAASLGKRLDSLESGLQAHDNIFGLRAKAAQEAEEKVSILQNRHQAWLAVLSLVALLAAAAGVTALFKKSGTPQRAATAAVTDQTARASIQNLTHRLEALESSMNEPHAEAPATVPAAAAAHEELAALSQRIDQQMNELRSRLVTDGEEIARLRSLLVLDSEGREHVSHELQDGLASAKSVAEPFLASVERLLGRLQLDSFRKISRDRVEPQLLQDACAHIRATLDEAQRQAGSLPAQIYVWEMARLQQTLDSVKGIERDAAKATTLRTALVRLLLSTYRSVVLREPMDRALDFAEDLKVLAPSDGPLRWSMECDGQGISADPADDRALWHLRGAKRAGNRTVLFPLVTENGAKLFAGVVTYEV